MNRKWAVEWPQWILIVGMFVLAAASWSSAPDRVPVHWNMEGHVDRYGSKVEGLLGIPLLSLGLYLLFLVVPRLDPGRANYMRFRGAYNTFRLSLLSLMAVLYVLIHISFRRPALDVAAVMPAAIGGLFIIYGNLLPKIRPNWFMGVRTPWTLSSKTSWNRTHRLGGKLFMLFGVLMLPAGVAGRTWGLLLLTAGLFLMVVSLAIYSYLVWRKDPDRVSPAGTSPAEEPRN